MLPVTETEKQTAARLKDQASSLAEPVKEQLGEAAQEVAGSLQQTVQDAVSSVKGAAADATSEVQDQARHSAQQVRGTAESAASHVQGATQSATEQVKDTTRSAPEAGRRRRVRIRRGMGSRPGHQGPLRGDAPPVFDQTDDAADGRRGPSEDLTPGTRYPPSGSPIGPPSPS